ncbi:hypothetical protein LCGC14_2759580, partial [marine sediment metagenome]
LYSSFFFFFFLTIEPGARLGVEVTSMKHVVEWVPLEM